MVETLLLREYEEKDVVVCYADQLERFVVPETKVFVIHAHNPRGISYATDVGMDKFPGEIVTAFQSVREKGLNMIDASV